MHGVALLVALELGLLSPLSCVVHCFIQQLIAEHAPASFFLCGEHHHAAGHAPASPLMPRALYEIVSLAALLLTLVSLLVAVLTIPRARRLVPQTLAPPTPPPRLALI